MKRVELEKFLISQGYRMIRQNKHSTWSNGVMTVAVPHHREVNKYLAKQIVREVEKNEVQLKVA